jgi:hypothetical protein
LVMSFLNKKIEKEFKKLNYLSQWLFTNEALQTDLGTSAKKIIKISWKSTHITYDFLQLKPWLIQHPTHSIMLLKHKGCNQIGWAYQQTKKFEVWVKNYPEEFNWNIIIFGFQSPKSKKEK